MREMVTTNLKTHMRSLGRAPILEYTWTTKCVESDLGSQSSIEDQYFCLETYPGQIAYTP